MRQRRRIVAEKNHALIRFQRRERRGNFGDMICPQLAPCREFFRQCFRFEAGQRDERGSYSNQDVAPEFQLPERLKPEFILCSMKTREAHTAGAADIAFAEFVIAERGAEIRAESLSKFGEACPRAVTRCVIAHTEERGVAGEISVGDDQVGGASLRKKLVEQMVL